MNNLTVQKGFTLLEVLIVVVIIGVLATVGIPMFNGYVLQAKIKASNENHARMRDEIAAIFAKCSADPEGSIKVRQPKGQFSVHRCSELGVTDTDIFVGHFAESYKNPHNSSEACCYQSSTNSPSLGRTAISAVGPKIRLTTNVGSDNETSDSDGGSDNETCAHCVQSFVTKE